MWPSESKGEGDESIQVVPVIIDFILYTSD